MLTTEQKKIIEQFMSYVLRHGAKDIGLNMDKQGYVLIESFIQKAKDIPHIQEIGFNKEIIEYVTVHSAKQRFAFNQDKSKIRANQGHTLTLDIKFKKWIPTVGCTVYHGTALKNCDSILKTGLKKISRHHVHLSLNRQVALENARRFSSKVVLFEIDVHSMYRDKIELFISENNVILTDFVAPKYLKVLEKTSLK